MTEQPHTNVIDLATRKKMKQKEELLNRMQDFASDIDNAIMTAITKYKLKPAELLFVFANRFGAIGVTEFAANDKLETFERAMQIAMKKYEEGIFKEVE